MGDLALPGQTGLAALSPSVHCHRFVLRPAVDVDNRVRDRDRVRVRVVFGPLAARGPTWV